MKTKKFKEISNEWIELKKLSVKYPTIAKYRVVIDTQLAHQFNDYTMEQFNEDIIIAYFNKLSTKENYANSTLLSIRYVLRAIINYSHQKYKTNNCSFELIKIAKKQRQINTLSNSQKINLSNYCFNNFQPISIAVAISLYTGLRIGEICALKWEDINFEDNYIYVYKTVERLKSKEDTGNKTALMILNPKTSSSKRIVPIPLFLNEFLVNYKSRYQIEDNNVFIIFIFSKFFVYSLFYADKNNIRTKLVNSLHSALYNFKRRIVTAHCINRNFNIFHKRIPPKCKILY